MLPQITPQQMRAARALASLSRERLAAQSDTTAKFVENYENTGRVTGIMYRDTLFDALTAIRIAFEAAGVEFTNGDEPGVKLEA